VHRKEGLGSFCESGVEQQECAENFLSWQSAQFLHVNARIIPSVHPNLPTYSSGSSGKTQGKLRPPEIMSGMLGLIIPTAIEKLPGPGSSDVFYYEEVG
jgi:hypothetical protein